MRFAVDAVKPNRDTRLARLDDITRLARLDDITREPRVGLIVDHYDADWSPLAGADRRRRGGVRDR